MNKHIAAILAAGVLWGTMGVFVRHLTALGVSSGGIAVLRCALTSVLFGIAILIKDRRLFRVRPRDLWCFLGTGLCSLLFFSYCYYTTIKLTSMSTASILLYTAPIFVMLMSVLLFKEKLTAIKAAALALAFAGCCLVSGLGGGHRITLSGLLFGLGAGFGYALYSIFGRFAIIRGYKSLTISFYSCLFAALGAIAIWGAAEPARVMVASASNAIWCAALAVVSCFLPYLLYTFGLERVENSRASIMASAEPVVATILGVLIYKETLGVQGVIGIILVIGAIVTLNLRAGSKSEKVVDKG